MSRSAYLTDENLSFILQDIGEALMSRLTDKELVQKSPAYQALTADLIAEWEQRLKQSEKKVKQIEKKQNKTDRRPSWLSNRPII